VKNHGHFSMQRLESALRFCYHLVGNKKHRKERAVARILQPHLFSWQDIDALSDLSRLTLVLENLPDETIVSALENKRANGSDTYPVRPTWNAVIAGIVFQHPTVESLLRELRRNGQLRDVCGFDPLAGSAATPSSSAMSRFIANVIADVDLVNEMFSILVKTISELMPDFGRELAFDGKAIPSHSTGRTSKKTGQASDPDAAWGIKSYRGTNKDGTAWEKVMRWFGYQLHLIVDANSELPVAFEVQPANASEVKHLPLMVDHLAKQQPQIVERTYSLAADRGLDSGQLNKELLEVYGIIPIIDTRKMWQLGKQDRDFDPTKNITRLLDPTRCDNIVFDERGTVFCVCPITGTTYRMSFRGFEADRSSVAWRCPAAAYGFSCKGREQCEMDALGRCSDYGRLVRIRLDHDRRIFTPIPRDSPKWKTAYAKRTSAERMNSRIDHLLGFERHTIRGLAKMRTRMGLALAVVLAMAVGAIKQGRVADVRRFVTGGQALQAAA
jgi:hypothetical protein